MTHQYPTQPATAAVGQAIQFDQEKQIPRQQAQKSRLSARRREETGAGPLFASILIEAEWLLADMYAGAG